MKSAKAVAAAVGTLVVALFDNVTPDMPPGTAEAISTAIVSILVWLVPNKT